MQTIARGELISKLAPTLPARFHVYYKTYGPARLSCLYEYKMCLP